MKGGMTGKRYPFVLEDQWRSLGMELRRASPLQKDEGCIPEATGILGSVGVGRRSEHDRKRPSRLVTMRSKRVRKGRQALSGDLPEPNSSPCQTYLR